MGRTKRKINILCLFIMIACIVVITVLNMRTAYTGLGNASSAVYSQVVVDEAEKVVKNCNTDLEKVVAIYNYMVTNYKYEIKEEHLVFQHVHHKETIETKTGICYDFANLFAALCRSQDIPCFVVEGTEKETGAHHAWNRVIIDDEWYEIDVTNDISYFNGTTDKNYGFVKIEGRDSSSDGFDITKIL